MFFWTFRGWNPIFTLLNFLRLKSAFYTFWVTYHNFSSFFFKITIYQGKNEIYFRNKKNVRFKYKIEFEILSSQVEIFSGISKKLSTLSFFLNNIQKKKRKGRLPSTNWNSSSQQKILHNYGLRYRRFSFYHKKYWFYTILLPLY